MSRLAFALLALSVAIAPVAAADAEPKKAEWKVGSDTREALIFAPAASKQPAPVVFCFHGHGGTAAHAARSYGFHKVWPDAVVVYLQGLKTPGKLTDPEGKKSGWQSRVGDQSDRDLKFFDAIVTTLKKDYKIDEKRVFRTAMIAITTSSSIRVNPRRFRVDVVFMSASWGGVACGT